MRLEMGKEYNAGWGCIREMNHDFLSISKDTTNPAQRNLALLFRSAAKFHANE